MSTLQLRVSVPSAMELTPQFWKPQQEPKKESDLLSIKVDPYHKFLKIGNTKIWTEPKEAIGRLVQTCTIFAKLWLKNHRIKWYCTPVPYEQRNMTHLAIKQNCEIDDVVGRARGNLMSVHSHDLVALHWHVVFLNQLHEHSSVIAPSLCPYDGSHCHYIIWSFPSD